MYKQQLLRVSLITRLMVVVCTTTTTVIFIFVFLSGGVDGSRRHNVVSRTKDAATLWVSSVSEGSAHIVAEDRNSNDNKNNNYHYHPVEDNNRNSLVPTQVKPLPVPVPQVSLSPRSTDRNDYDGSSPRYLSPITTTITTTTMGSNINDDSPADDDDDDPSSPTYHNNDNYEIDCNVFQDMEDIMMDCQSEEDFMGTVDDDYYYDDDEDNRGGDSDSGDDTGDSDGDRPPTTTPTSAPETSSSRPENEVRLKLEFSLITMLTSISPTSIQSTVSDLLTPEQIVSIEDMVVSKAFTKHLMWSVATAMTQLLDVRRQGGNDVDDGYGYGSIPTEYNVYVREDQDWGDDDGRKQRRRRRVVLRQRQRQRYRDRILEGNDGHHTNRDGGNGDEYDNKDGSDDHVDDGPWKDRVQLLHRWTFVRPGLSPETLRAMEEGTILDEETSEPVAVQDAAYAASSTPTTTYPDNDHVEYSGTGGNVSATTVVTDYSLIHQYHAKVLYHAIWSDTRLPVMDNNDSTSYMDEIHQDCNDALDRSMNDGTFFLILYNVLLQKQPEMVILIEQAIANATTTVQDGNGGGEGSNNVSLVGTTDSPIPTLQWDLTLYGVNPVGVIAPSQPESSNETSVSEGDSDQSTIYNEATDMPSSDDSSSRSGDDVGENTTEGVETSYYEPLILTWGFREYFGMAMASTVVIYVLMMASCASWLRHRESQRLKWGLPFLTESGVNQLLDVGWRYHHESVGIPNQNDNNNDDDDKHHKKNHPSSSISPSSPQLFLQIYDRRTAGCYNDDNSLLKGGVEEEWIRRVDDDIAAAPTARAAVTRARTVPTSTETTITPTNEYL